MRLGTNMPRPYGKLFRLVLSIVLLIGVPLAVVILMNASHQDAPSSDRGPVALDYRPRRPLDLSGNGAFISSLNPWKGDGSLEGVSAAWIGLADRDIAAINHFLTTLSPADGNRTVQVLLNKAVLYNWKGDPDKADEVLEAAQARAEREPPLAEKWLYTLIFARGVTALRRGENENCVSARGVCSCILPIDPSAFHTNPPARARRSSISRNISTSFLTISRSAGCSTWPT